MSAFPCLELLHDIGAYDGAQQLQRQNAEGLLYLHADVLHAKQQESHLCTGGSRYHDCGSAAPSIISGNANEL
jgi:hypothetical protein